MMSEKPDERPNLEQIILEFAQQIKETKDAIHDEWWINSIILEKYNSTDGGCLIKNLWKNNIISLYMDF